MHEAEIVIVFCDRIHTKKKIYFIISILSSIFLLKLVEQDDYLSFVFILIIINSILSISLNLVNGWMGEFSVGHSCFMAIGAYSSAMMSIHVFPLLSKFYQLPECIIFFCSVCSGGMIASIVGLILGYLSFKTRGDYLSIVTFSFLFIIKSSLENISFIGAGRGLLGIPHLTTIYNTLGWGIFIFYFVSKIIQSKYGRNIIALREDEIALATLGVSTQSIKLMVFIISAFFTGVAGALFAHQLQFIIPSAFDINKSLEILVMVYFGGLASISGSLFGAIFITILVQLLQPLGIWKMIILPSLLVALMLIKPTGFFGYKELPILWMNWVKQNKFKYFKW